MRAQEIIQNDIYLSTLLEHYTDAEKTHGATAPEAKGVQSAILERLDVLDTAKPERTTLKEKIEKLADIVKTYKSEDARIQLEKCKKQLTELPEGLEFNDVLALFKKTLN